ncbi:MerR family transcriptional regulator [Permianibacter aggregans]|uniref:DNA-binding transcriptional MerR regulator n=1 Tax=Permianibacter aggregans TaxID=1510150 RepID=A0A4R6U9R7_9GAMM|nr:MerR family transcriptional regulator [Permianibacter aggregans]QGX39849.1 MerR family transcriptional regulator [Permianibacter aggregans]TDQ41743.1 DNA-binding transcriptional MerR regulator [Permianibacter aggregans]
MANATESLPDANRFPLTISALAKHVGLSRSTLLYYDRIGLLQPSAHTDAGYRLYTVADAQRLQHICRLRNAGLGLAEIKSILATPSVLTTALEKQFLTNNQQISALQNQQRVLLHLLGQPDLVSGGKVLSKESWTEMFRALGLSDQDMWQWHRNFEASLPEAHQAFLESLGIEQNEISQIRARSGTQN